MIIFMMIVKSDDHYDNMDNHHDVIFDKYDDDPGEMDHGLLDS